MKKYKIKQWLGETIPLEVLWDTDITATATLRVYTDGAVVFEKAAPFIDNLATLDMSPAENTSIGAGIHRYLVYVEYTDGDIDIIPTRVDMSKCDDETCEAPILEICEVTEQ